MGSNSRQHGLSVNSFNHWRREAAKQESGALEAAFFEIQVAESESTTSQQRQPDLEVELPLGVKLRFFGTAVAR